jgi:hypothetical protein
MAGPAAFATAVRSLIASLYEPSYSKVLTVALHPYMPIGGTGISRAVSYILDHISHTQTGSRTRQEKLA